MVNVQDDCGLHISARAQIAFSHQVAILLVRISDFSHNALVFDVLVPEGGIGVLLGPLLDIVVII
jgi:hypothetical protein